MDVRYHPENVFADLSAPQSLLMGQETGIEAWFFVFGNCRIKSETVVQICMKKAKFHAIAEAWEGKIIPLFCYVSFLHGASQLLRPISKLEVCHNTTVHATRLETLHLMA